MDVPRLFCVGPITSGSQVILPKTCTDGASIPGVPATGPTDVWCSVLSSSGASALLVTENVTCDEGETGVVITRDGESSFSYDLRKNGVSLEGFPITAGSESQPLSIPVCYLNTKKSE